MNIPAAHPSVRYESRAPLTRSLTAREWVTTAAVLFCLLIPALAQAQPSSIRFDHTWWSEAPPAEQEAFVAGYLDCRQQPVAERVSLADYRAFITARTGDHADFVQSALESAMRRLRPAHQEDTSANAYAGHFWGMDAGQTTLTPTRRGFVEGFLACTNRHVTPAAVEVDVRQVNSYYQSELHHDDRIADVLAAVNQQRGR